MLRLASLIQNENMKVYRRFQTWTLIGLLVLVTLIPVFLGHAALSPDDWRAALEKENVSMQEALQTPQVSEKEKIKIQNQFVINEYRLTHNLKPVNSAWGTVNELSMLINVVTLFTVIVTADMVAKEFSGGTIKMLLTRPVSRSVILLSKYICWLLFGLTLLALLFVESLAIGIGAHGLGGLTDPYLYVQDGAVRESSMLLHTVSVYGLKSINMLMIGTLAFMISAVFRSSNMAISISIMLLFSGDILAIVLREFSWSKYLLFANTDLTRYLNGAVPMEGMSLAFSVTVLAAYFVLFNGVSWTVFAKRDVA